jgi:4-amino-4-deoxy-L-arabinose transferase-like glycosyltransferase
VNQPNPAIVAQSAARRLPRGALLLFCLAYLLPGFLGRNAWKSADVSALGFMSELVQGTAQWLQPTLMGLRPENPAVLPYWLGAWCMQWGPSWMPADLLARLPFAMLLALAMTGSWYGTYYLARSPRAQPVAFAFGGEALPKDYARAMADGGLLALIACLGLGQLGHEATPALAQLGFSGLLFYALASLHFHPRTSVVATCVGVIGLGLSGAPSLSLLFLSGGLLIHLLDCHSGVEPQEQDPHRGLTAASLIGIGLLSAYLCMRLDLWRWKVEIPQATWSEFNGAMQLLTWFTWPAWPLALWTLWRWRRQLVSSRISRHLALPVWFVLVTLGSTFTTGSPDRTLLLGLPALAALAAFALPTLKRQVAALIDWFTLLFFSGCGFTIWVVWIAMQTGYPSQPAANVQRLAPGFEPHFSGLAFSIALVASLIWTWLVKWRVGRHRAAIWRSLVLPAGGAALCWLLLMTLWMPLLNYTQSYNALVRHTLAQLQPSGCVETQGLGSGKIAAFTFYGNLQLKPLQAQADCPWLIAEPDANMSAPLPVDNTQWNLQAQVRHPADGNETLMIFRHRQHGEEATPRSANSH